MEAFVKKLAGKEVDKNYLEFGFPTNVQSGGNYNLKMGQPPTNIRVLFGHTFAPRSFLWDSIVLVTRKMQNQRGKHPYSKSSSRRAKSWEAEKKVLLKA